MGAGDRHAQLIHSAWRRGANLHAHIVVGLAEGLNLRVRLADLLLFGRALIRRDWRRSLPDRCEKYRCSQQKIKQFTHYFDLLFFEHVMGTLATSTFRVACLSAVGACDYPLLSVSEAST